MKIIQIGDCTVCLAGSFSDEGTAVFIPEGGNSKAQGDALGNMSAPQSQAQRAATRGSAATSRGPLGRKNGCSFPVPRTAPWAFE